MTARSKELVEVRVFKRFAKICPLAIELSSVRKNDPPAPDISCKLKNGLTRSFELVEVVDSCVARSIDNTISLQRHLEEEFARLSDETQANLANKFDRCLIGASPAAGVSLAKQKSACRALLEFLAESPPGTLGTIRVTASLRRIFRFVHVQPCDIEGVRFSAPVGSSYGDPLLQVLKDKFSARYESEDLIDLLAYYDMQVPPPEPRAGWFLQIREFVESNISRSCFKRVWVFSARKDEESILLVVPERDELGKKAEQVVQTERYEEAANVYERILEIDPGDRIALVNLGIIHVDHLPDPAKARCLLERAIELYPDEGNAYYSLGVCEGGEGNSKRAISLYAKAIRLKWRPGRAHHNAGKSYWDLADIAWREGKRDQAKHLLLKAMRQFLKAAKIIPDFPLALRALGSCYYNLGFYDKAIKYYNLTLQIVPTDIIAWRGKFRIYAKQGNYEKVQEAIDEVRRWAGGFHSAETILRSCEAYLKNIAAGKKEGVGPEDIAKLRKAIVGSMENLGETIQRGFEAGLKGERLVAQRREMGPSIGATEPWTPDAKPFARGERERLLSTKRKIDREGAVIGESDVMLRVFERIHQLNEADSKCPLVLLGETGVGKTFIVPCIVSSSGRADKGWTRITAQLFASGDFTAIKGEVVGYALDHGFREIPRQGKPGILQHFKGGTIFIDELLDLPREMQALLLDVIDSLLVQQVGDKRKGYIPNVRVIFGTNRDPAVEVREGNLRHDLWDRVSRFTITIPPLRDRKEDIPFIARRVLGETTIHTRILLTLMLHDWRAGNVRELIDTVKKLPKDMNEKFDLACLELPEEITSKVDGMSAQEIDVTLTKLLVDLLEKRGFERGKGLIKEMAKLLGVSEAKASGLLKQAGI